MVTVHAVHSSWQSLQNNVEESMSMLVKNLILVYKLKQ